MMATLGVFILWFCWFGFNPGSSLEAAGYIGHIAMTTNLSACAGALVAMFLTWKKYGKPDVSMTFSWFSSDYGWLSYCFIIWCNCNWSCWRDFSSLWL